MRHVDGFSRRQRSGGVVGFPRRSIPPARKPRTVSEHTAQPYSARQEKLGSVVVKVMSKLNIWAYRATRGKIGGTFLRGAPVMLLTTTGRKSGRPRTAPLIYLEQGDDLVIVASKGGMSHHPAWFRNLEANPDVGVEIGSERRQMRAQRVSDAEKAAFWPELTRIYRDYDDYQARTDRNIPVVVLSPR
jgi:deazaflavin-dependent oxidoreductase (nitroreductase family)